MALKALTDFPAEQLKKTAEVLKTDSKASLTSLPEYKSNKQYSNLVLKSKSRDLEIGKDKFDRLINNLKKLYPTVFDTDDDKLNAELDLILMSSKDHTGNFSFNYTNEEGCVTQVLFLFTEKENTIRFQSIELEVKFRLAPVMFVLRRSHSNILFSYANDTIVYESRHVEQSDVESLMAIGFLEPSILQK